MKKTRNIKLKIEYKGDEYFGFQMQKNKKTVQGEILKYLKELLNEEIYIFYSGRTDRGVHSLGQIVNFKISSNIELFKIKKFLNTKFNKTNNKYLKVKEIEEVPEDFNANLFAKGKKYKYIINTKYESGLFNDFEYTYVKKLDIDLMKEATKKFIGKQDFKAFCNSDNETATTVRSINDFNISEKDGRLIFEISADGFLNKMVRIIIGTILEIGEGKKKLNEIDEIFKSKDRKRAGRTLPAKGLYLVEVIYEENI